MATNYAYYKQLFEKHDIQFNKLTTTPIKIIGKKRKYEEAMGYANDYEVVQEPPQVATYVSNWVDAYTEQIIRRSLN
jgi:hypothetical protein